MENRENIRDIESRILYRDSDIVVVNKIAGEAVEGTAKGMADLPKQLAAVLPAAALPANGGNRGSPDDTLPVPVAAHRLDVPVSGCVAFARTRMALRFLNTVFRGSGVEKRYWAVVEPPQEDTPLHAVFSGTATGGLAGGMTGGAAGDCVVGELTHWIQFDSRRNRSSAFDEPGPGRKKAVLRYRLVGRGRDYLFFEIEPVTGRHHQIRAQFERAGLHVKGDLKYGARRSEKNGGIRLHARLLSFPESFAEEKRITIQADPPLRDNLWIAFMEAIRGSG